MRQTSILAYRSLSKDKLGQRQKQVLEVLRVMGVANNREISEKANLPINVVTPRCGELRTKGVVEEAYKDTDKVTGRVSTFWKLAEV